jgi:2-amino-4-hydroxy-6-hydroxymethyldihydropteridine diphosphokinase
MLNDLYLGFGSNLGDRLRNIIAALKMLDRAGVTCKAVSSVYNTKPYGPVEQSDFLNCVGRFTYEGTPNDILSEILRIEEILGRERTIKWGPRTVDIDILLCDKLVIDTERLGIPHKDIINRAFVLVPLLEVDPEIKDPRNERPFFEYLTVLKGLVIDWPVRVVEASSFARLTGLEVKE